MTNLQSILSRVESGSGDDIDLSDDVMRGLGADHSDRILNGAWRFDGGGWFRAGNLTTDLNAVVALVEARLPGWWWAVGHYAPNGNATANVSIDGKKHGNDVAAPTPARALLAALIRAEMEKVT